MNWPYADFGVQSLRENEDEEEEEEQLIGVLRMLRAEIPTRISCRESAELECRRHDPARAGQDAARG